MNVSGWSCPDNKIFQYCLRISFFLCNPSMHWNILMVMRVVVCLEIERIKAHILIWTARPERAPEWSVVKPDETCSWPTGRTPPSRDRCHRTRTETSLLSCNTQTLHECIINSWALYQHLTLKHKSYISPNVSALLFWMNLILQDMHVINYINKITSSFHEQNHSKSNPTIWIKKS